MRWISMLMAMGFVTALCLAEPSDEAVYSWQKQHAEVLDTGDLLWQPLPFRFVAGDSVRYIDYEAGDDANAGTTPDAPWRHHPWDPNAQGQAAQAQGVDTYVFKRGVVYRGRLVLRESGTPQRPIRLTSDPDWGSGEAVIAGSLPVTGWRQGADHADIPEPEKVWYADLDYLPRRVWVVSEDGTITHIPLARTPNWTVSNPEDVMSEWWTWEQPQWWVAENRTTEVDGRRMHLGIDSQNLTRDADYYEGAMVWTEWGIVMGTPFPTRVQAVDTERGTLAFEGIWFGDSGVIITKNRYFLEDKPHYLDDPNGEFWFDRRGEGGRLYLRVPDGLDPNTMVVEAGRLYNLIEDPASANAPGRLDILSAQQREAVDTTGVRHVEITGLTFRSTNRWWDLEFPEWMHKEVNNAAIRLQGSTDGVNVANCRFEQVTQAVRIGAITPQAQVGSVRIADNQIHYTYDSALSVSGGESVRVMRNDLYMIGLRPSRQSSAHALGVYFPRMMEIAGNMLTRCYGAGVFVFGGKGGGTADTPMSRHLIHHNRVEQALLAANDWGAIETWQGGPFYIYNNVAVNPNGYWNWQGNRLGYAYYLDGGFKNYLFNNIAWGISSEPRSFLGSTAAFQQAVGTILNTFFNNTAYRFVDGSNWSPTGGHNKFLGNIFADIGGQVFKHGQLKEDSPDEHVEEYPHETTAYGRNVFHDVSGTYGVFEMIGREYRDFPAMRQALRQRQALAADLGHETDRSPLRDPENMDLRPAGGSAAIDSGVKYFVPWGLYAMVGEWNFYHAGDDPTRILDEHWYLAPYYTDRGSYRDMRRFDLTAVNVAPEDYVQGPLEDWIAGALRLNGRDQYAVLRHEELAAPIEYGRGGETVVAEGADVKNVDVHHSNFLVEIIFRTEPGQGGVLVSKRDAQAGYALTVNDAGGVTFTVAGPGGRGEVVSTATVADGKWHHVIAECDRESGALVLYVNGRADARARGVGPEASLSNTGDFHVGGTPDGGHLAGTLTFLRVALGTLADARTSIEELYAWQFDGPFLRDFTSRVPSSDRRDAGAIEYQGQ